MIWPVQHKAKGIVMIELTFISRSCPREEGGYGRPKKPGNLRIGPYTFEPISWQACDCAGRPDSNGSWRLSTYRNETVSQEEIDPYLEKAREEGGIRPLPSPTEQQG